MKVSKTLKFAIDDYGVNTTVTVNGQLVTFSTEKSEIIQLHIDTLEDIVNTLYSEHFMSRTQGKD